MTPTDPKKHSDGKSEHHYEGNARHGKSQGVTINPDDVGAGGGSVPAGHGDQDSRTWDAGDNQENAPRHKDGHQQRQVDRSNKADFGMGAEQVGNPGHRDQSQEPEKNDREQQPAGEKQAPGHPHDGSHEASDHKSHRDHKH